MNNSKIDLKVKKLSIVQTKTKKTDRPYLTNLMNIEMRKKRTRIASDLYQVQTPNEEIQLKVGEINIMTKVDSDAYIKTYEAGIVAMLELPKAAQHVLKAMLKEYGSDRKYINTHRIYISYYSAQYDRGYDQGIQNYRLGRKQLIEANYITPDPQEPNWYWINPDYVYNGSKIKELENIRKEQIKDAKK